MHILEHLFLVGEFPPRAHLLSGLTLEQVTLCPDGASHSIYEELWHVVAYQQSIIGPGDPADDVQRGAADELVVVDVERGDDLVLLPVGLQRLVDDRRHLLDVGILILTYVMLGWVAVAAFPTMIERLGVTASTLVAVGGLLYTLGALVYAFQRPDPAPSVFGYHEVFHALVILAAALQYAVIAFYVIPGS